MARAIQKVSADEEFGFKAAIDVAAAHRDAAVTLIPIYGKQNRYEQTNIVVGELMEVLNYLAWVKQEDTRENYPHYQHLDWKVSSVHTGENGLYVVYITRSTFRGD